MNLSITIKNHYKQVKNKIFDKGFGGVWKGLKDIYHPNKLSKTWLLIDLILFATILCIIIDLSCLLIGYTTAASFCCGNSIVVSRTGILTITDDRILESTNDRGYSSQVQAQLVITPVMSLIPLSTEGIDRKNNLSEYGIPYFLNITKIYYSTQDFDALADLGNSGSIEIHNLLIFGRLSNCIKVYENNHFQEKCYSYPFLLSSNTSLLINDSSELKIDKVTFDYYKQTNDYQSYLTKGDIKLYYTISKKEERPAFYLTTTVPFDVCNIFIPWIGRGIDYVQSYFRTDNLQ